MRPVPGTIAWPRWLVPLTWGALWLGLARWPWAVACAPVLGLLDGPLGLALAALCLGVAIAATSRAQWGWPALSPRLLFAASALVLIGVGQHYTRGLRVTGDEPHYLIMARSLWQEGDLDLRDNYARREFEADTPGPVRPHYGAPRADGRPFPAHNPGLPALLAPVYALGGRRACAVLLGLLAALVGVETWRLSGRFTVDPAARRFAWLLAIGPPVALYGFHVYTEVPAALALIACLRLLLVGPSTAGAVGAACLAASLPWLHLKLIPAAAALGLVALWRLRGRALLAFALPTLLAAAAFAGHYQHVFGQPTPLALYGGLPPEFDGSAWRALAGLLLDRSFGLLPHAPAWILTLAALPWLLGRAGRRDALAVALVLLAVLAPVLTWRMWWGGQCPPARFLVPAVPLLALAVAARSAREARGLMRWRWPLLLAGYALVLVQVWHPGNLYLVNRGARPTRLWEGLSGTTPIGDYLPSLVAADPRDWQIAAVWLVALATLFALDRLAMRSERVDAWFRGLALPSLVFVSAGTAIDLLRRLG